MRAANWSETFIGAWANIDFGLDRFADFAPILKDYICQLAAEKSIQAASDWINEFAKAHKKISKYPYIRGDLEKEIKRRASESDLGAAMEWFLKFELKHLRLNTSFLTVSSHDGEVLEEARAMAAKCERAIMDELAAIKARGNSGLYVMKSAERLIIAICQGAGVDLPGVGDVDGDEKLAITAMCVRLFSEKWWRGQLRKLQARKLEAAARILGMVCKKRGGYCSIATLRRRGEQKRRNRDLLELMEAENNNGQIYTLAELSDLGVSNPVNRRAELMTRIRGFEEVAEEIGGWTPVFITQTCPSRFHSHRTSGEPYPNWNGSTPRDAQEYLTGVWSKVRAQFAREQIPVFGFRVAEPHHDGCPHWHSLFWVPKHQLEKMIAIYQAYALRDDPPARGNESARFKVLIDELASGATSYIAKYISKNVDGLNSDGEAWSADVVKTAVRTEAWASTWGIRQFQQIGGASVTVYREMRRLRGVFTEAAEVENIRKAADSGDWKQYTLEMGGPVLPLKERPLRAYMARKADKAGEKLKNAYGEFVKGIRGVMAWNFLPVRTRLFEWVIRRVKVKSKSKEGFSFWGAQAPPLDLCQ